MSDKVIAQLGARLRHMEGLEPVQPRYGDPIEVRDDVTLGPRDWVVFANSGTNAITITLPAAADGWGYYVKMIDDTLGVEIVPAGAAQIDGAASYTFGKVNDAIQIISDGTNWWIVASHILP